MRVPGDIYETVAALFMFPKTKSKCPSIGEWINKFSPTVEYYTARKNNELLALHTDMDGSQEHSIE